MTLVVEDERIAKHLAGAERQLRARDVRHLPLPVRRVRDLMIDTLAAYRRSGRFPRNYTDRSHTPVFIDEHGTRCAMAHLLESVGAHTLVQRVQRTNNLARIRDLAGDPELLCRLAAMGLTVDEAARIQPSYCAIRSDCYCTSSDSVIGVALATPVPSEAGGREARIDTVLRGTGFAVGDVVPLIDPPTKLPTSLLVSVHQAPTTAFAKTLPRDEIIYRKCGADILVGLELSRDELIDVIGPGCAATLAKRDARYAEGVCWPEDEDTGYPALDFGTHEDTAAETAVDGAVDAATAPPLREHESAGCNLAAPLGAPSALALVVAVAAARLRSRLK